MAHIIARRSDGPRGVSAGGSNAYQNLILLCPTCHTTIDKAPEGEYHEAKLHDWKREHENSIRSAGKERSFESFTGLKEFIKPLLIENHALWITFGPQSTTALDDQGSNLHMIWALRKLDRIVPNNMKIMNVIESNQGLLDERALRSFIEFKLHAKAFEANQDERFDSYPTFPLSFGEIFTS